MFPVKKIAITIYSVKSRTNTNYRGSHLSYPEYLPALTILQPALAEIQIDTSSTV
ncbi:hypothetical protein HME9304_00923 [Flagellimonas maritima]|uniref:Uncharacterized protein n=1 Tax=Flagellimonas maritima TaxID=1383885 RepID=A0A2Z4LQ16_9FLAO|nr:hypothetical protein HME9304_00923 [Allomuricauda aurantiaca]